MDNEFHRIKRLPPYVFAEVNALKAHARAQGRDIVDFGMGNPDQPPPAHVIAKLAEAAASPRTHGYSASRGIPGLRKAISAYYARRFDVDICPETETIATIGSKEGLANLAQAMTSPGDIILAPNPSYPIHAFGFIIAGAAIRSLPVRPGGDFMEQLARAVRHSVPKPRALILNYPSNPTAQVVDLDFYEQVVDFCQFHGIYIISDLAYAEIYFDDVPPPSILQVRGAREVAVEFLSMSKSYSMAGWRIGFCSGNKTLVAALTRVKSYVDYGAFTPIQVAATAALNGPQDCVGEIRARYRGRRDVLIGGLIAAGWDLPSPPATMFAWAPVPQDFAFMGSVEFSKLLLHEAEVAVAPGIGFGEYGEGFVRLGLVENEQRIRQAVKKIKAMMARRQDILAQLDKTQLDKTGLNRAGSEKK